MVVVDLTIQKGDEIIRPFLPKYVQKITHPSGMQVELIDAMGDDLSIVNAARVSYGKESKYEDWYWNDCLGIYVREQKYVCRDTLCHNNSPDFTGHTSYLGKHEYRLKSTDRGVLNYMMRERHGSPFEMVVFKFRVIAPIKVIWEWVRHRISSFNIMSTRYVEWDTDFYTPQAEQWRRQVGKPGNYTTEQITNGDQHRIAAMYAEAMLSAFEYYGMLIDLGLHKEVAANILPMGAMTQMIWTLNLRSLYNFLELRTGSHALEEIQICAQMVEALAETVTPVSFELWREHGKHRP